MFSQLQMWSLTNLDLRSNGFLQHNSATEEDRIDHPHLIYAGNAIWFQARVKAK